MKRLAIALAALSLSACEAADRRTISQFTPLPDGRFQFRAQEAIIYSQRDRIAWLEQYLDDNGLCPNGYEIDQLMHIDNNALVDELFIAGHCVDAE